MTTSLNFLNEKLTVISKPYWDIILDIKEKLTTLENTEAEKIKSNIEKISIFIKEKVSLILEFIAFSFKDIVYPLYDHDINMDISRTEMLCKNIEESQDIEVCNEIKLYFFLIRSFIESLIIFLDDDIIEQEIQNNKKTVNLNDLMTTISKLYASQQRDLDYKLNINIDNIPNNTKISGNIGDISILILNILKNSYKHGLATSQLIEVVEYDDMIYISFLDNGKGIDVTKFPDASTIFNKGETTKGTGSGLRDTDERGIIVKAEHNGGLDNSYNPRLKEKHEANNGAKITIGIKKCEK